MIKFGGVSHTAANLRVSSWLSGIGRLVMLCLLAGIVSACIPAMVERQQNTVVPDPDAPPPSGIGKRLFIADLHADSLLWDRDLLDESDYGHVDLPRLVSGNVALQVFTVVTKTPLSGAPPDGARLIEEVREIPGRECIAAGNFNLSGALSVLQLRPPSTWFDLEARAMNQAKRLKELIARSIARRNAYLNAGGDPANAPPSLMLITTAADMEDIINRRRSGENVVGALLALEGAHWLDGDTAEVEAGVDRLFDAGFRMVAPTHRFNNSLGASSEGCDQLAGLTEAGKVFLKHAEKRRMVIDLAHASDKAILQGTAMASGPVAISHTGVRFDCPQSGDPERRCTIERGMTAKGVQAVARTGGIVGIGYWPQAVGVGVSRIGSAYRSTLKILSEPAFAEEMEKLYGRYEASEHLALGSDYDGVVEVPFDVSDLGILFAELEGSKPNGAKPLEYAMLRRIAGGNACRVFVARLPGGSIGRARELCDSDLMEPLD